MTGAGVVQLWVVRGGQRHSLGTAATLSLNLGGFHRLELDLRGSQLGCWLDGSEVVQATDTTFARGRVALVAAAGSSGEFGSVRVSG